MKLSATIDLYAGGPGSGCHGPNCGRPEGVGLGQQTIPPSVAVIQPTAPSSPKPKVFAPGSGKGQYAHYGKSSSKKIMGVWVKGTAIANLYTHMMTGEWNKVSDLQKLLDDKGFKAKLGYRLYVLGLTGKKLGLWDIEYQNGKSEARMLMKRDTAGKTEATQVTGTMANAALVAAQKLLKSGGDVFSADVMKEFLKQAGVEKGYTRLFDNMHAWTGSSSSAGGMFMKAVAAEYYGRKWSDEYKKDRIDPGSNFEKVDSEFKKTMMSVKSLAAEYAKLDGTPYVYRGFSPSYQDMEGIRKAVKEGKPVAIPVGSLSSWSTSVDKASNFGNGVVLRQQVQPENVWVTSKAMGHLFGTFREKEWIMGSKDSVMYFKPEDIYVSQANKPDWCKDC